MVAYESRLKRPFVTARASTQGSINYVITLTAEHGDRTLTAVGEATPRGPLTGDPRRHVWPFLSRAMDHLHGSHIEAADPDAALAAIRDRVGSLADIARSVARKPSGPVPMRGSLAGIETALLDLGARAFDMSLSRFLGGNDDLIEVSASSSSVSRDLEEAARRLRKRVRRFRGWRLKADARMNTNLAVLRAMSAINHELGRDNLQWLDFNESMDPDDAAALIERIAEEHEAGLIAGKIMLEQPVPAAAVAELCALQARAEVLRRDGLDIVIMADECIHTLQDFEALAAAGSCRAINIKVPKAGGLLASIDIARAAHAFDPAVEIYLGGMIATSEITSWTLNQLAKALPGFRYTTVVPHHNLVVNIATRRYAFRDRDSAVIVAPQETGLGTGVDAERLAPLVRKTYTGSNDASARAGSSVMVDAREGRGPPNGSARAAPRGLAARLLGTTKAGPRKRGMRSLLVRELEARGIPYELLTPEQSASLNMMAKKGLRFSLGSTELHFVNGLWYAGSPPRLLNGLPGRLFPDKALTSAIVRGAGLPTPVPYTIAHGERVNLRHVFEGLSAGAPQGLVVKPNRGKLGRHVYLRISTLAAFEEAVAATMTAGGTVIVEPMVPGTIFRFFVVDGSVVAVRHGVSASGHSNRHQGARVVDATGSVHASYRAVAEGAVAQFPGTFVAGVDVAIPDPAVPARLGSEPNCHVIEINSYPGFIGHHFPDEGAPVDVAGRIVDALVARFVGGVAPGAPLRVVIRGRVQRVGFRRWLQAEARRRDITGFVRNRSDGTVEAVLSGSTEAVDALVALARTGPSRAVVAEVRTEPWRGRQRYRRFVRSKTKHA